MSHFETWSRRRHRAGWLEKPHCAADRFGGFFDLTPGASQI